MNEGGLPDLFQGILKLSPNVTVTILGGDKDL